MKNLSAVAMALALAVGVTGCGVAAKVNARNDMEQSKSAYKTCLVQNAGDIGRCHGYKLAYDADMRAYRATSAGIRNGYTVDVNED